jgi:hypothetical protein
MKKRTKIPAVSDNLFDQVYNAFKQYVVADEHKLVALTLWTLHTHVYNKFMHTPRLVIASPVPNCGKTTILNLLRVLSAAPEYIGDATPAGIFEFVDGGRTVLVDEVDNLGVSTNRIWRNLLNSGHMVGGSIARKDVKYSTFAPIALAGIGIDWVYPALMSRALLIFTHRNTGDIPRLDLRNVNIMAHLFGLKDKIALWADNVNLNIDPPTPKLNFDNKRPADNWRALYSIADNLGYGELARKAAKELYSDNNEDVKVTLLQDIRKVFDTTKNKFIPSGELVGALRRLDGEISWMHFEYKKKFIALGTHRLAEMLRDFEIEPDRLWWPEEAPNRFQQKFIKGYNRAPFEIMWRRYTPAKDNIEPMKKTA